MLMSKEVKSRTMAALLLLQAWSSGDLSVEPTDEASILECTLIRLEEMISFESWFRPYMKLPYISIFQLCEPRESIYCLSWFGSSVTCSQKSLTIVIPTSRQHNVESPGGKGILVILSGYLLTTMCSVCSDTVLCPETILFLLSNKTFQWLVHWC